MLGKQREQLGSNTGAWYMPGELYVCHLVSPRNHPTWDSNCADGGTEAQEG